MNIKIDGIGLLSKLLEFKNQKTLLDTTIYRFVDEIIPSNIEAKIYFLREFKEIASKIPIKAFDSLEQREKFLSTIQSALDMAINAEDEILS